MLQACAAICNHHHKIHYYGVEIYNIYLFCPPPPIQNVSFSGVNEAVLMDSVLEHR
jgi:hypothetical protein